MKFSTPTTSKLINDETIRVQKNRKRDKLKKLNLNLILFKKK